MQEVYTYAQAVVKAGGYRWAASEDPRQGASEQVVASPVVGTHNQGVRQGAPVTEGQAQQEGQEHGVGEGDDRRSGDGEDTVSEVANSANSGEVQYDASGRPRVGGRWISAAAAEGIRNAANSSRSRSGVSRHEA